MIADALADRRRGRRPARRCSCSTSTASRPSTTRSATQLGDRCCARWASGWPSRSAPATPSAGSAATSSSSWPADCDSAEAAALAFRLQTTFTLPFVAVGHLRAAVGQHRRRRLAARTSATPHQLLSDADAAMFAAKSSGRDRVHLFSPGLREAARWRLEVATRLRGRRDRPARRPLPAGGAAGHRRGRGRRGAGPLAAPRAGPPAAGRLPRPSPRRPVRSSRSPAGCCARRPAGPPSGPRRGCRCACR